MFRLDHVTKRFGALVALDGVDLELDAGRTTVLIGPSGCGKSTLLRLLIGLEQADAGAVRFDGTVVAPASVAAIRRRLGYVIQDGGLFPHLTARANVALMARELGWEAARIDARITELAGLTHFPRDALDRFPAQLSGGQRQRVGLMRALMLDPEALLLDEPLGALDPMIRAELQQELRAIFAALGKTVVLVTHDLDEAAWFGDRIVLLRSGRVVQAGPLDALVDTPSEPFVTRFVQAQRPGAAAETGP